LIDENTRNSLADGFRIGAQSPTQLKIRSQAVPLYSAAGG